MRTDRAYGIVILLLSSTAASGVTWSGTTSVLPGTTLSDRPELVGQIIASQTFAVTVPGNPEIDLQNWVVREDSTGLLDFYYQFINPNSVSATVPGAAITGFDTGPALDVDRRLDAGGLTLPVVAVRSNTAIGTVPGIFLGNPERGSGVWILSPVSSLTPIFIHTNATSFQPNGEINLEGVAVPSTAYIPSSTFASVPEPANLTLVSIAAVALAYRARRRQFAFKSPSSPNSDPRRTRVTPL